MALFHSSIRLRSDCVDMQFWKNRYVLSFCYIGNIVCSDLSVSFPAASSCAHARKAKDLLTLLGVSLV